MKTRRIIACAGLLPGADLRRPAGRRLAKSVWLGCLLLFVSAFGPALAEGPARHAIAMHGEPAFPADFAHMPYANPDAPKGGRLVFGVLGTFDSLNPLIVRGLSLQQTRGHVDE